MKFKSFLLFLFLVHYLFEVNAQWANLFSYVNDDCSGDSPLVMMSSPSGKCIGNMKLTCGQNVVLEEIYYLSGCLVGRDYYKWNNNNCMNSQTFNCTDKVYLPSNSYVTEIFNTHVSGCTNDQSDILQYQTAPLETCIDDQIYSCNATGITVRQYQPASQCQGDFTTNHIQLGCSHGNSMMSNYLNVYCTN